MADQIRTALRILRRKQVSAKTGIPGSSLYAMMDRDEFPRPIRLSKKAVGWPEHIVDAWIESRIKAAEEVAA